MSNKIPCGGFYLDDMLNVNDSGELSIKGGTPYQQLVTDGEGGPKWEDRLAYDDSFSISWDGDKSGRVVVTNEDIDFVKVSDTTKSVDELIGCTLNGVWEAEPVVLDAVNFQSFKEQVLFCSTSNIEFAVIFEDNVDIEGLAFPEKGLYFVYYGDILFTKSLSRESIKKLDEKFLPDQPVFYVSSGDLVDAEGVKITLEQAKAVGLNFIIQMDSGVARPISAFYGNGYASFYAANASSGGNYSFTTYFAGGRPIN